MKNPLVALWKLILKALESLVPSFKIKKQDMALQEARLRNAKRNATHAQQHKERDVKRETSDRDGDTYHRTALEGQELSRSGYLTQPLEGHSIDLALPSDAQNPSHQSTDVTPSGLRFSNPSLTLDSRTSWSWDLRCGYTGNITAEDGTW